MSEQSGDCQVRHVTNWQLSGDRHVTNLHKTGYDNGQHDEREAEDVEKREGHKSLVCRQSIFWVIRVLVAQSKSGKGNHSNLSR